MTYARQLDLQTWRKIWWHKFSWLDRWMSWTIGSVAYFAPFPFRIFYLHTHTPHANAYKKETEQKSRSFRSMSFRCRFSSSFWWNPSFSSRLAFRRPLPFSRIYKSYAPGRSWHHHAHDSIWCKSKHQYECFKVHRVASLAIYSLICWFAIKSFEL